MVASGTVNAAIFEIDLPAKDGRPATLRLAGQWILASSRPSVDEAWDAIRESGVEEIALDSEGVQVWDSALLVFVLDLSARCSENGVRATTEALPPGIRELLRLATEVPEHERAEHQGAQSFPASVGEHALRVGEGALDTTAFVGEAAIAFGKMLVGRARFRGSDLVHIIDEAGPRAVPIITLIGFLMGLILAFVGAMQLRMFGAEIYVADLVGIGIVREMGAIMTGVVMAGRTGASFAAQLGTMQVNEEVDALQTMGVPPIEFLVLPRILALAVVMPFLCLYADVMGILGGMVVGVGLLDLGLLEYYRETIEAVRVADLLIGVFMSGVFGVLIALCGCLKGIRCGRSSAAVGIATTSAVVTSIVCIVVATAVITVLCDVIGV